MIQRHIHVASRLLSPPLRQTHPAGVDWGAGLQAKRGMSSQYLPAALPPSTCFTVMLKLLPIHDKALLFYPRNKVFSFVPFYWTRPRHPLLPSPSRLAEQCLQAPDAATPRPTEGQNDIIVNIRWWEELRELQGVIRSASLPVFLGANLQ